MKKLLTILALYLPALAWAQTAHLWIDTNGGACTRQSTPAVYNDAAACSSIQAALAAASNGDTVRVKAAATYGSQSITAAKGAPGVTVRCEVDTPSSCVFASYTFTNAAWITIQNINFDIGDTCHNCGNSIVTSNNITFLNVTTLGAFQVNWWDGVSSLLWDGGGMWSDARPGGAYYCANGDGIPLTITADAVGRFSNNVTLRNVVIGTVQTNVTACGADNAHIETLRIDGDVRNLLLDRVIFRDGRGESTGTVFLTQYRSELYGSPHMTNIRFRNSYFGTNTLNPSIVLGGGNPSSTGGACGLIMEYNTIRSGFSLNNCASFPAGLVLRGNAGGGWAPWFPCNAATHIRNVWQWTGTTACGTDTTVIGPQWETGALGIGTTGYVVNTGSPLINAGETSCAATANGQDIRGFARPVGAACDAGAFEFGATGGSGAPSAPTNFRFGKLDLFGPRRMGWA
jgi:hypothetical protein